MRDIVQASGLAVKQQVELLDKIVDKKEQFKDEHLKKLVQSDKYSIRRLVKNIQNKIKERKEAENGERVGGETELPTGDVGVGIQPDESQRKIEQRSSMRKIEPVTGRQV